MDKQKKDLLVFGYGLTVIAVFIGMRLIFKHGGNILSYTLFVFAAVMAVLTSVNYLWLKSFYVQWMRGAGLMGHVVSTTLLMIIYYLCFAPVGILFRIIGKDMLDRKIDRNQKSYWIELEPRPFKKEAYHNQF